MTTDFNAHNTACRDSVARGAAARSHVLHSATLTPAGTVDDVVGSTTRQASTVWSSPTCWPVTVRPSRSSRQNASRSVEQKPGEDLDPLPRDRGAQPYTPFCEEPVSNLMQDAHHRLRLDKEVANTIRVPGTWDRAKSSNASSRRGRGPQVGQLGHARGAPLDIKRIAAQRSE